MLFLINPKLASFKFQSKKKETKIDSENSEDGDIIPKKNKRKSLKVNRVIYSL